MPQAGQHAVAVAGGAAAGIGLAAGRQDNPPGANAAPRRGQSKARRQRLEVAQRFFQGQDSSGTVQAAQQGIQDVTGLVADGEDFAGRLDLGGDALGLEEVEAILDAERRQGGVEERSLVAEGRDDAAIVGGMGDVAARAAAHQDLDAGLAVFFQQQHAPAALGRADGRHQSRRAGADHHHVPHRFRHRFSQAPGSGRIAPPATGPGDCKASGRTKTYLHGLTRRARKRRPTLRVGRGEGRLGESAYGN